MDNVLFSLLIFFTEGARCGLLNVDKQVVTSAQIVEHYNTRGERHISLPNVNVTCLDEQRDEEVKQLGLM